MQKMIDTKLYKVDLDLPVSQRIANYLNWAAEKYPYVYSTYPILTKAVLGLPNTPRPDSRWIESIRHAMTHAKLVLYKLYSRSVDSQPGVGLRATVDDADVAVVVMPKKVTRFIAARKQVTDTRALIDLKKLPENEEGRRHRAWLSKDVDSILKALDEAKWMKALPPGKKEDE